MAELSDTDINELTTPVEDNPPFITVADIKAKISEKLYNELTDEDDSVTERCIATATVMVTGLLSVARKKLHPANPLHREAARLLTVYQMYVYNGDEQGGREYLVAATDLLSTAYGNVESAKAAPPPVGAIKKPQWKGRHHFNSRSFL